MKVSLIVLTHDGDRVYLRRCLESLINQSYSELEIIVVDSGNTPVSDSLKGEYNVNWVRDTRIGATISYYRNVGLKYATGLLVGFVDADDYLSNDAVSVCIDSYDDATVYLHSNYISFQENNIKRNNLTLAFSPINANTWHIHGVVMCRHFNLIPKRILIKLRGYNPHVAYAEEWDLFNRLLLAYPPSAKYKWKNLSSGLYYKLSRPDNVTSTISMEKKLRASALINALDIVRRSYVDSVK